MILNSKNGLVGFNIEVLKDWLKAVRMSLKEHKICFIIIIGRKVLWWGGVVSTILDTTVNTTGGGGGARWLISHSTYVIHSLWLIHLKTGSEEKFKKCFPSLKKFYVVLEIFRHTWPLPPPFRNFYWTIHQGNTLPSHHPTIRIGLDNL